MRRRILPISTLLVGVAAGLALAPTAVQAAVNYFDTTRIVTGTGTVYCPSGSKVTGGGTYPLPNDYHGSTSSSEYSVTGSYPSSTTAWKATGKKVQGTYSSTNGWHYYTFLHSPKVYAICAS